MKSLAIQRADKIKQEKSCFHFCKSLARERKFSTRMQKMLQDEQKYASATKVPSLKPKSFNFFVCFLFVYQAKNGNAKIAGHQTTIGQTTQRVNGFRKENCKYEERNRKFQNSFGF